MVKEIKSILHHGDDDDVHYGNIRSKRGLFATVNIRKPFVATCVLLICLLVVLRKTREKNLASSYAMGKLMLHIFFWNVRFKRKNLNRKCDQHKYF